VPILDVLVGKKPAGSLAHMAYKNPNDTQLCIIIHCTTGSFYLL